MTIYIYICQMYHLTFGNIPSKVYKNDIIEVMVPNYYKMHPPSLQNIPTSEDT